jgi:integrase
MVETVLLTDAAVRRLKPKPGTEPRLIKDAGAQSLYLRIAPRRGDGDKRNAKSWLMRFRGPDGRPVKIVLGPFDLSGHELKETPQKGQPLSVRGARALAADVHRRRAVGEDVAAQHKAERLRHRREATERPALTYGACVVEFFRDYKTRRWHARPRRWREDARVLGLSWPPDSDPAKTDPEITRGGLAEAWADKPIAEIDEADIITVVDAARKSGIPGLDQKNSGVSESRGRRMHGTLSAFFRWLQGKRRVLRNPCRDVFHPGAPAPRDRLLTADELRWLWAACADEPLYGPLVRLLVLTGQRLNEVAGLRRSEVSADQTTWTIPTVRAKNHRENFVWLAPPARELLANIKTSGDLVFSTTGVTPLSGWSRLKNRITRKMLKLARAEHGAEVTIKPWRLHDLRRVFVSGCAELGIRSDVIEVCVNHRSDSRRGVAGVYNLSILAPARKECFERWALHVAGIVEQRPVNVTRLADKKARRGKA